MLKNVNKSLLLSPWAGAPFPAEPCGSRPACQGGFPARARGQEGAGVTLLSFGANPHLVFNCTARVTQSSQHAEQRAGRYLLGLAPGGVLQEDSHESQDLCFHAKKPKPWR